MTRVPGPCPAGSEGAGIGWRHMDLRSVLRYSHPMHMICNTQPQSILDDPDTGMIFDRQKDVTGVNNIAYIYIYISM